MSPGQTEMEGYIAWITYHLLLGQHGYEIQPLFQERFGDLPAWIWRDAFTAANRGMLAAASAFGADLSTTLGSHLDPPPDSPVPVDVRLRIHFRFPDGTEKWMMVDLIASSDQTMAGVYTDAISAAQSLAQRSGSSLVEFDLMPPLYELT